MSAFTPGARLGPYQILDALGAGGMGEVYRATDIRLDRTVAIKVLPSHWADNTEMRQRFEREAQTLASLNHPHICVLFDIGSHEGADYLVMEHLEGETLATRLERGPVPLDEALKFAIEIADALDKAHRRGVVHRDLKPANVMLTKSGTKLLDFGLAKWAARGTTTGSNTQAPTALPTGKDITTPGTVLGTLQYMAPEQLEGLEADARTDIFAFGALLHEMVTGKRAFDGKSRVLLISAIATLDPPPISSVEPAASAALDHVVKVCLAKEPDDRWQTACDLLAELEYATAAGGGSTSAATQLKPRRAWLQRALLTSCGLLAGAIVTAISSYFAGPVSANEPLRFRIPIQLSADATVAGGRGANLGAAQGFAGVSGVQVFSSADFAISPDGTKLVFRARQTNQASEPWFLYVRPIESVTPQKLAGTEGALRPFWSPDGRAIAFVAEGKLKRIDYSGGPAQDICPVATFFGGAWNSDGTILFGSMQGIQRVSAEGGTPQAITKLVDSETGHYWPHFLPDGRHFFYTAWSAGVEKRGIDVASLDSTEAKTRILPTGSNAAYTELGYLVFHRENAVYAQPFDAAKRVLSGDATRIADEVVFDGGNGQGHFSISRNGALAYFFDTTNARNGGGGPQTDLSEWQLSWLDRTASNQTTRVGIPGVYRGVEVSPADPRRIAVHRHDVNGGDIWILEPQGSDLRLTFDAKQHNSSPVWSPDGSQIAFASLRKGKWGIYTTLSTRSGTEQLLYESELQSAPMSWVGKYIAFWVQDSKNAGDVWVLNVEDKKAEKMIATPANETRPQISPDGKWIAYTDNSKDDRNEIYVRPFPTGTGIYQISDKGGDWPRWRGDSKELFYHSIGANATPSVNVGPVAFVANMFAVQLTAKGPVLEKDPPRIIQGFPVLNLPHSGGMYHSYAVDPKSGRFLVMQFSPSVETAANTQIGPDTFSGLTVALHWESTLKK